MIHMDNGFSTLATNPNLRLASVLRLAEIPVNGETMYPVHRDSYGPTTA